MRSNGVYPLLTINSGMTAVTPAGPVTLQNEMEITAIPGIPIQRIEQPSPGGHLSTPPERRDGRARSFAGDTESCCILLHERDVLTRVLYHVNYRSRILFLYIYTNY